MRYVFGDYTLDTQRYELHRAGVRIPLRPKVFQVLAYLLQHRDRVVRKAELLEHLWPNQFIGDGTLNACIMAVRKALGDGGRTPQVLRTVHGQGYRFVAPVAEQAPLPPDPVPPARAPHASEDALSPMEERPTARTLSPPAEGVRLPAGLGSLPVEPLAGEHKQVTMLCGALAEAPALAARLGPEAMHHLMADVLALVQSAVQRYEGHLTPVLGDGFLALFGAPMAQEDHARRAVLAALEMRQGLRQPQAVRGQPPGEGLALRLALHTGPVVIGGLAYDPQRPYTAVSATLYGVMRLQALAPPDTLLVSAATYALVHAEVQGEEWAAGPVYAVHGLRQRQAGVPRRGGRPLSRFVGRRRELALLHERLAQAMGGQGQVIGIAGEPGIGKSRLLAEFAQSLDGRPVTYGEGHCLAYGSTTPYLPVLGLLRQCCGLPDTAPAEAITTTVRQRLAAAGGSPAEDAPFLLHLLDVPVESSQLGSLSPQACKARTFALLRQVLLHSRPQPCVLAVENLHWIDATSEEWLAALVAQVARAPLLLLLTYRPGYRPPWIGHSAVTQLALAPLTPRESLAVMQGVPQAAQLPVPLQQAIVTKAAGNPFFLEELALTAVERGPQAVGQPVPDTIQAVLATRIDRLPPEAKGLLQTAAVIGHDVPGPLLQAVAGRPDAACAASLDVLQAAELLYETRAVPALAYTFKHVLLQEVAYESLLTGTRQQLHQRIAQVVEAQFPDLAETQPELLAQHYTAAGCAEQAVAYWQRAGQRARQRVGEREAIMHFRKGLDVLQTLPPARERDRHEVDLLLDLWVVLGNTTGFAETEPLLTRARALCEPLGDTPQLFWVLHRLQIFYRGRSEHQTAREYAEQALCLAQRLQDPALRLSAHMGLGHMLLTLGDLPAARSHCEHALAHSDARLGGFVWGHTVQAHNYLAHTLWLLGYPDQAVRRNHAALTLVQERSTPVSRYLALYNASTLHQYRREWPAVHAQTEAAIALVSQEGTSRYLPQMLHRRGWVLAAQGQYAAGIAQMSDALTALRAMDALGSVDPRALSQLAEAYGQSGQVEEGIRLLAEARAAVEKTGAAVWAAEVQRLTGELLLRQAVPDEEQAAACFQQALAVARRQQAKSLELRAATSCAHLWQRQGKRREARALLAGVYSWFTEGFDTADLQEAKALLDALA
jgi:DNA-binding winged helix-turn-helix (wHTH) protein/predicted ATPase